MLQKSYASLIFPIILSQHEAFRQISFGQTALSRILQCLLNITLTTNVCFQIRKKKFILRFHLFIQKLNVFISKALASRYYKTRSDGWNLLFFLDFIIFFTKFSHSIASFDKNLIGWSQNNPQITRKVEDLAWENK